MTTTMEKKKRLIKEFDENSTTNNNQIVWSHFALTIKAMPFMKAFYSLLHSFLYYYFSPFFFFKWHKWNTGWLSDVMYTATKMKEKKNEIVCDLANDSSQSIDCFHHWNWIECATSWHQIQSIFSLVWT